jgi:hypothetical protein
MNSYDFTKPGGFPLDQGVMGFLQDCISLASQAASLAGPLAILSGCVVAGGSAGNGFVVINGEILPFVGGIIQEFVVINEVDTAVIFQDGSPQVVKKIRTATFGDDSLNEYAWADFQTNTPAGVLARLGTLEAANTANVAAIDTLETNSAVDEGNIAVLNTTKATKLASGNAPIGNPAAPGQLYTINFPAPLPNTNYFVACTIISNGANPENDLIRAVLIRAKTVNSFTIYLSEPGPLTQDISLDWMVFSF